MITILNEFKNKAKLLNKKIALPDSLDIRTLKAANVLLNENIATPILFGNKNEIQNLAEDNFININGINIVDKSVEELNKNLINEFYEFRKHKGISIEQAKEIMNNPLYIAGMYLRNGLCDSCVAGSISTTAEVIKAGIQTIGLLEDNKTVSSFFLIEFKNKIYSFADCAIIPEPNSQQLADIAIVTAKNFEKLLNIKSKTALLSFSTKGSAEHSNVSKITEAIKLIKQTNLDLLIDGELQLDAAIVPDIALIKDPNGKLKGEANVLVFPNLDAGNIAYKMAQRMAGAKAIGPIVQGLNKPYFDLSRGCSVEDIIDLSSISILLS